MGFGAVKTVMLVVAFVAVLAIMSGDTVEGRKNTSKEEDFQVEGFRGRRNISEQEDLEFDRQLRILNKPAVKTITTEHGGIYDCVDIHKQPALDHPALKNHKIQIPKDYWSKVKKLRSQPNKFGLKEGCPLGTVPIRRTTKEDLIRAKSIFQTQAQYYSVKEQDGLKEQNAQYKQGDGTFEFAGFRTKETPGRVYHGSGANFDVYNPKVQDKERSSAIISIESGPPNERNLIQFGWTVNPGLYHDSQTRLFTSWTKDNYKTTGCVNTACPGFIHMYPDVPLDYIFAPISIPKGTQHDVRLAVYQHDITKVWNFYFGKDSIVIGYWAPELFSHLASGADFVYWGGVVYSPNISVHSPQMGSGVFKDGWYQSTCYFRAITYTDKDYIPVTHPDNNYIEKSESRCYLADDNSYKDEFFQYSFNFGGKGGAPYECIV